MKVAVVARATAGFAQYLFDSIGEGGRVVVGCDARYGSHCVCDQTAEVLSAAGMTALALPKEFPTPITGCGVPSVAPADGEIAARIAAARPADGVPRDSKGLQPVADDLIGAYVALTAAHRRDLEPSRVRLMLTAMHGGVGGEPALAVLNRVRVGDVHPVAHKFDPDPDPDFPTVPLPNPEEPGTIHLSVSLASEVSADLVVALDPDADCCSLAIPLRAGTWRQLNGDEIGALLGEQAGADDGRSGDSLACSIVATRLLERIAGRHGLHATSPSTFRVSDLSIISDSVAKLRGIGISAIAGSPVVETVGLAVGADGASADRRVALRDRSGRPGAHPALRHRAETEVLPGGSSALRQRRRAAYQRSNVWRRSRPTRTPSWTSDQGPLTPPAIPPIVRRCVHGHHPNSAHRSPRGGHRRDGSASRRSPTSQVHC